MTGGFQGGFLIINLYLFIRLEGYYFEMKSIINGSFFGVWNILILNHV